MTRLRLRHVVTIAAVAACWAGGAAPALAASAPVWQGTAFVTAVSGNCASNGVNVGTYYTMLYREQAQSGNTVYGGGVQFASQRSSVSYVMPANDSLPSGQEDSEPSSTLTAYGQSSLGGPFGGPGNYIASFDLTISSTSSGTATNVTITGTVNNLWNYSSPCNVTIEASLALQ